MRPFIAASAAAMLGVQEAHLPLPAADGSEGGSPLGPRSATCPLVDAVIFSSLIFSSGGEHG